MRPFEWMRDASLGHLVATVVGHVRCYGSQSCTSAVRFMISMRFVYDEYNDEDKDEWVWMANGISTELPEFPGRSFSFRPCLSPHLYIDAQACAACMEKRDDP